MPNETKRPVINPKSAVRAMKKYRNRKPDDEGKVRAGKGRGKRSGK